MSDSSLIPVNCLRYHFVTSHQIKACKSLLNDCLFIAYSNDIKELTINLKQKQKIALPDALIAATAIHHNLPILTFDKGFSKIPGINLVLLK